MPEEKIIKREDVLNLKEKSNKFSTINQTTFDYVNHK
jgi:hypothetical protein